MQQNKIGLKARLREKQGIKEVSASASAPEPKRSILTSRKPTENTDASNLNMDSNFPELVSDPLKKQSIGAWAKGIDTIRSAVNIPAPVPLKTHLKADTAASKPAAGHEDQDSDSETSIDKDWGEL